MKKDQTGSHIIGITLVILAFAVIGLIGFKVLKAHKTSINNSVAGNTAGPLANNCKGNGTVQMQHMPMDLSDVSSIMPAGLLAGAHVTPIDHMYFYPKDMKNRDAAPVYAMADGYIVDYQERTQSVDNGATQKGEYRIFIQYSCDFFSYYDLMTSMDSGIQGKLKAGDHHLAIKAGQVIGRVGAQSLDTAIYNYAMTLPGFVNPDSYKTEGWKIHLDDFFKYFNEPLLSQMLALNPRKVKPYGGKIDYDIAGKLVGNWFEEGTNGYAGPTNLQGKSGSGGVGYWNGHFSIAPDAVRPNNINISFGSYLGQATQFTAVSPLPNPADVGVSDGLVKYELTSYQQPSITETNNGLASSSVNVIGTVLLQVLDGNKMKMEAFSHKTAAEVSGFTSAVKTYVR